MMPSSSQRSYSRFIPSEEVGDFTQWKFGAWLNQRSPSLWRRFLPKLMRLRSRR